MDIEAINMKDLREAVKALNDTGEVEPKIKVVGAKKAMVELFTEHLERLNEAGVELPIVSIDFYNELYADEEDIEKEEEKEEKKKPAAKKETKKKETKKSTNKDDYPYGNETYCVKCNHTYSKIRFCDGGNDCNCSIVKTAEEHIERTCTLCGFIWAVKTKDKEFA